MDEHECSKLHNYKNINSLHLLIRATIEFGITHYIFFSKNVLRETMAFSVMMENAYLSISNAMVIKTARMEAMKKIVD